MTLFTVAILFVGLKYYRRDGRIDFCSPESDVTLLLIEVVFSLLGEAIYTRLKSLPRDFLPTDLPSSLHLHLSIRPLLLRSNTHFPPLNCFTGPIISYQFAPVV